MPAEGRPCPPLPATWIQVAVLSAVVGLHFVAVAPSVQLALELQLLSVLGVVLALRRWWGPAAPTPVSLGNVSASLRFVAKIGLVGLAVIALVVLAAVLVARIGGVQWDLQPGYRPPRSAFGPWLLLSLVWAPLIEEPLYRGVVHARLQALTGRTTALVVSSFVFWALHWAMQGQLTPPHHFAIGMLLAGAYDRTRSLLAPMLLHALINLVIIADVFVRMHYPQALARLLGW